MPNMSVTVAAEIPVDTVITPVVVDVGATLKKLETDIGTAVKTAVSNLESTVKADVKVVETDVSKVISGHWFATGFLAASVLWLAIIAFSLHADKLAVIEKATPVLTK